MIPGVKGLWTKMVKPRYGLTHLLLYTVVLVFFLTFAEFRLITQLLQSPLPNRQIAAEQAVSDTTAYRMDYEFTIDWFTQHIPVWEAALEPFRGKPDIQYLEVGLYEGRSAIWMLENILTHPTARMTGMDIFDGTFKERYFANIERSGLADKVNTITGYSQIVLRSLPLNSFDIVYIDGSHSEDDVLEDAVLSWRLLKENGVLIFDDYQLYGRYSDNPSFPKIAIDPFVRCFGEHLEVIHNSSQLFLRKKPSANN